MENADEPLSVIKKQALALYASIDGEITPVKGLEACCGCDDHF
jgi:hypothetical protein